MRYVGKTWYIQTGRRRQYNTMLKRCDLPAGKPRQKYRHTIFINPIKPNDLKKGRTPQLISRCCILCIYTTNIRNEYFKHAA